MTDQPQSNATEQIKNELNKIPPTTDRNMMAALSYVWILSIVMLAVRGKEPFIKFHAKQALVLFILSIFSWIPVLGWIVGLLALIGMILGFINAWQGKEYRLPFVADLADRFIKI